MTRRLVPLLSAALLLAAGLLVAPAGAASAAVGVRADDGATVVAETRVSARILDVVVQSPALGRRASVRLWLPKSWGAQPAAKWPELWLLHGANEPQDYRSWTLFTNMETLFADKDVLVVMPSAGSASLYTDQYGLLGIGGTRWETFHTVELPQIIARGYRGSARRVVAGLSSGGLGAFKYAANHPGMFRAAAAYSGLLNTRGSIAVVNAIEVRAALPPNWTFGDPLLNGGRWAANNPLDLAPKLVGVPLYLSSGNGTAGELDAPGAGNDTIIEPAALSAANAFVARGQQLGLTMTTDLYGAGTHSWPYWQRELFRSWPFLAKGLGVPR